MALLAVIIAALGGFATGAVWYMTLAKPWMAAAGIAQDADGNPVNKPSPIPYVISLIAALLAAGVMQYTFTLSGIDGPAKGLMGGLGVGLFLIAPWLVMNYAYAMRPRALMLIDGGYAVLGPSVIGLILGLF